MEGPQLLHLGSKWDLVLGIFFFYPNFGQHGEAILPHAIKNRVNQKKLSEN